MFTLKTQNVKVETFFKSQIMCLGMIAHVVILALRKMRQEAQEFKVPLGYVVKTCLGKKQASKQTNKKPKPTKTSTAQVILFTFPPDRLLHKHCRDWSMNHHCAPLSQKN